MEEVFDDNGLLGYMKINVAKPAELDVENPA